MMRHLLLTSLTVFLVVHRIEATSEQIKQKFMDEEIVPDILDSLPETMVAVTVTYPTSGVSVDLGNALTPSQVRDEPKVEWEARAGVVYTLLMTDPDAPSRANATRREIRHWLTVNIEGNNVTAGESLFGYRGSGPPVGTGLHRYIFLLFEQRNGRTDFGMIPVPNNSSDGRANTSTRNLMSDFNLTLVGGDFFQAEFEVNEVSDNIKKKFTDEEIVPDVIESLPAIMAPLKVTYEASNVSVSLGNKLKPSQVQVEPKVEWEARSDAFYTLLFTDPDAPSRANHSVREFRHWLAINIKGNDVKTGEVVYEYRPSGPMNGTGLHRYTFLVFEQRDGKVDYEFTLVPKDSVVERRSTSARTLMSDLNLTLIAGDYFLAEFEVSSALSIAINIILMSALTVFKLIF